ncbi:hypothetical protein FRC03_002211 [Tulasnella sp. 419]|nr:hypothetical protein FRC03_002211 [Tulasnella sp. 419]
MFTLSVSQVYPACHQHISQVALPPNHLGSRMCPNHGSHALATGFQTQVRQLGNVETEYRWLGRRYIIG